MRQAPAQRRSSRRSTSRSAGGRQRGLQPQHGAAGRAPPRKLWLEATQRGLRQRGSQRQEQQLRGCPSPAAHRAIALRPADQHGGLVPQRDVDLSEGRRCQHASALEVLSARWRAPAAQDAAPWQRQLGQQQLGGYAARQRRWLSQRPWQETAALPWHRRWQLPTCCGAISSLGGASRGSVSGMSAALHQVVIGA